MVLSIMSEGVWCRGCSMVMIDYNLSQVLGSRSQIIRNANDIF